MNNVSEGLISILDTAEDRNSELEDIPIKTTQKAKRTDWEKKKKTEQNIQGI